MYLNGKNMNVVQLENISKSFNQSLFKKKEILTDINLNIQKGEFVVLKGANGSGKTTLLNLILGLLAPTQGEVNLFGENPKSFHSKTRLGVVLQKVSLPKNLTVKELVNLLRSYYPNPLSTEEILSTVNLKLKENNWASKLSGGEEQRLFFALALAGNPELLILDEPTRNLDEEGFIEFWEQIKICREKNITILLDEFRSELSEIAISCISCCNNHCLSSKDNWLIFSANSRTSKDGIITYQNY
jgi:ABC-type multidrug transport system ATPase subunit